MAPTNNSDMQTLLNSLNLLTEQVTNMGQQITDLQRQQQPAPPGTPAPTTITSTSAGTINGTSRRAADIGYFYPDMPMSWGTGDVIDREGQVYCRGVYGFTDKLKRAAQSRNVNFVRNLSQNMETCFRGEALRWWNDEVNTLTRRGLVYADTMDEWSEILQKRFRAPPSQAWSNLDSTRYTLSDVRNKKSVAIYVSSLVSAAKQCGETEEFPIVRQVWKHLDLPLRCTIDEPIEGSTVISFTELLVGKQSNWVDTYEQRQDNQDICQHGYECHVEPVPRNDWLKDPPQLTPRYSTTYAATGIDVVTETFPPEILHEESPQLDSFVEDFCQAIQSAQTYGITELESFREESDDHESFDAIASAYTCNICHSDFPKLHAHIRDHSENDSVQAEAYVAAPTDLPSIEPIAKPTHDAPGCALRSWKNPAAQPFLTPHGHTETTCIAKNDSKKVSFVIVSPSDSHENAFWRDHGEHVGRPEDHG